MSPWTAPSPELAVLLASFNRRDVTLTCLRSLRHQTPPGHRMSVRLLDAGSTDGTVEAVSDEFPEASVVVVPGVYWARSMVMLAESAVNDGAARLLFLNDDVRLEPGAVERLLDVVVHGVPALRLGPSGVLAVGATRDPTNATVEYGGMRRSRVLGRLDHVGESPRHERCDTSNFNIAMMSTDTYRFVGGLSKSYEHSKADWDFGFRLTERGGHVVQLPGVLGECAVGGSRQTWLEPGLRLRERLHLMEQPKGVPLRESLEFARRHYGVVRGSASIGMIYARVVGAQLGLRVQR
jgi:GT2 family glycosyltransferase